MKTIKGFSLIELMVVVAIVAILGTVAMPAYQTYLTKTRVAEVLSQLGPLKSAIVENAANGLPFASGSRVLGPTKWLKSAFIEQSSGSIRVTFQKALTGDGVEYVLLYIPKVMVASSGASAAFLSGTATSSVIPEGSAWVWTCRVADTTYAGTLGTLPRKYAPEECAVLY